MMRRRGETASGGFSRLGRGATSRIGAAGGVVAVVSGSATLAAGTGSTLRAGGSVLTGGSALTTGGSALGAGCTVAVGSALAGGSLLGAGAIVAVGSALVGGSARGAGCAISRFGCSRTRFVAGAGLLAFSTCRTGLRAADFTRARSARSSRADFLLVTLVPADFLLVIFLATFARRDGAGSGTAAGAACARRGV